MKVRKQGSDLLTK